MRLNLRCVVILTVGALALAAPRAFAASPNPVKLEASLAEKALAPGATSEITVAALLDAGWHIYSLTQPAGGPIATSVKLDPTKVLELAGEIRQGAFEKHHEAAFGVEVESFTGKAEFWIPVRVLPATKLGKYTCSVRVRFQACDGKMCLPPTDHIAEVSFEVVAKHVAKVAAKPATAVAKPKEPAPAVPPAGSGNAGPARPSVDLAFLWETAKAWENDKAATSKLVDALPALLTGQTFSGEDAYNAGRLWLKCWGGAGKDEYVREAATQFEAYLASPAPLRNAEPAEAYLIFALARSKRLDEATRRFEGFYERYKGKSQPSDMNPTSTNTELASTILVYSLGEAKRYAELEKVARLCLEELRKKRENEDRNMAFVNSHLFMALDAQNKADDAAKARIEAAKSFNSSEKMMGWAEWFLAFERIEELMKKLDPAGALKVLKAAHENYVKAGMEKLYDATLQRFKVAGRPAPRLEADAWLNSAPLSLEAVRGKVVVLDFWMTWCGPCRMSFPKMEALVKNNAAKGLMVVGVTESQGWVLTKDGRSVGKDDADKSKKLSWEDEIAMLKEFVKDFGITVPVAFGRRPLNPTKEVTQTAAGKDEFIDTAMVSDYGVSFFPTAVVIDRKGVVRFSGTVDDDALGDLVKQLLEEPAG
jgi:thiol:disulfide interchange protein DsbD